MQDAAGQVHAGNARWWLKEGDLESFGLKKVKRKGERIKEVPVRVNQQDVTGEKFIVK